MLCFFHAEIRLNRYCAPVKVRPSRSVKARASSKSVGPMPLSRAPVNLSDGPITGSPEYLIRFFPSTAPAYFPSTPLDPEVWSTDFLADHHCSFLQSQESGLGFWLPSVIPPK